jgi:transposase
MARPVSITRLELSSEALRREAARSRDGDVARRLLAIALVLDGWSREAAAETCGMDRQTLRDWVHRYNDDGIAGLANRKSPGRPAELTDEQLRALKVMVEEGPDLARDGVVRWRCVDLQARIAAEFGVYYHERSVGKLLAKLDLVRLSPRPFHPQKDAVAEQTYKKTSLR